MKKIYKKTLLSLLLLHLLHFCFSQTIDSSIQNIDSARETIESEAKTEHFSGALSVTSNGISVIPTFTLGKPAAIVNMSISKGKFSFEPDLRFSLDGKPWNFLFWFRYKLLTAERFHINIGAH